MNRVFSILTAATAFSALASPALAGGGCIGNCYQRVAHPPVYRQVAEQVMVRPSATHAEVVPAQLGTVAERVVLSHGHVAARTIPAQYGTVAETVQTSPGGKVWQVTRDAHGREIGCWVYTKPTYSTYHRTVMTRPAQTFHDVVPPVYGTRERTVVVRPQHTILHTSPAVYQTQVRQEMVQPASESWQPAARPSYGHAYHPRGHYQHRRPIHARY